MIKPILLLFVAFLFSVFNLDVQAQITYFFKNDGTKLKTVDGADFIRLVYKPEKKTDLYKIMEYFLNGKQKSIGYSPTGSPIVYEGRWVSFYETGHKKQIFNYEKGKLRDSAFTFFPNGKLYSCLVYDNDAEGSSENKRYITVNDSLGNKLVVNGQGICSLYTPDFKSIKETGTIENGFYNGEWKGYDQSNKVKFTEIYGDGKFISGRSIDENNNEVEYTVREKPPLFQGDIKNFYKYLQKNIRYPPSAVQSQTGGVVKLTCTITKDGSLVDVKVLSRPHYALVAEAVRVVEKSPKWEPGYFKGRPVNSVIHVPVSFRTPSVDKPFTTRDRFGGF